MTATMLGARKHESASCQLHLTLGVPADMQAGIRELSHLKAEKPGQGHGTALLEQVCAEADERHLVLVLVAKDEKLMRWYEKFGFFVLPDSHGMMGRPVMVPATGALQ